VGETPNAGFLTIDELEERASTKLPPDLWAYVEGGAAEERTVRSNREAFARVTLRPRVLAGVAEIDLRTPLLGRTFSAPVFVCPTAYQAKVHPDGEAGAARAAGAEGLLSVFSTLSSHSIEEIARASGDGGRWFQLYHQPDETVESRLIERAENGGYDAIVVTVDTPVLGTRDRQARGGFAIDTSVPIGNGPGVVPPPRNPTADGGVYRLRPAAGATWAWFDRLRASTRLPVVVKGILTADDARLCVDHGARGVIVSNHGGRQLDGAPATLAALPEVATAVGSKIEVYLDGGVRRGADVLAAVSRGARAVGIGRPVLWALAVGGEQAVQRYLSLLKLEIAVAMALSGRRSIAEIDASLTEPYRS